MVTNGIKSMRAFITYFCERYAGYYEIAGCEHQNCFTVVTRFDTYVIADIYCILI